MVLVIQNKSNIGYTYWERFLIDFVILEKERSELLKNAMDHYNYSLRDFAKRSEIPESTLYKISSSNANIKLSTLYSIIETFREIEQKSIKEPTVAVITSRNALQELKRVFSIEGKDFQLAEYPAMTIEEEIIKGIQAQNDGCIAIICGPIAANTLDKIVRIPVVGLTFYKKQIEEAILKAIGKIPHT